AEYICKNTLNPSESRLDFRIEIIDGVDRSGIDDIRSIKSTLAIKAGGEGFNRAVILKDFHKISIPAQNSILKLLEEPPEDTLLIVLTNSKNGILPTVASRLHWIDVLPLKYDLLEKNYNTHDTTLLKQAYLLSDGYW